MTPKEIVQGVIDLFSDQSKWMQGGFAQGSFEEFDGGDIYMDECSSHDDEAVCFCLMGAVDRISSSSVFQGDCDAEDAELQYPEEFVVAQAMLDEVESRGFKLADAVSSPGRYYPIAEWNDAPGRTIEEVRHFCDNVMKRLETA